MNRLFISYRSSDGRKDAARLAADLNEYFGDPLVFYDRQDLVGGTSWRAAITATRGARPVVLVLVTPDLLGAEHPEGGRRIDRADDPIRGELITAEQHGAVVLPLLVDGTAMPPAHQWPPPLRFVAEAHARPLRTDDWNVDLQRIIEDLKAHGIAPASDTATSGLQPLMATTARSLVRRVQGGLMVIGGLIVALVAIGLLLPEDPGRTSAETAAPSAPAAATAAHGARAGDVSGVWWAVDAAGHSTRVQVTLHGSDAVLQTDAIPVAHDAAWQAYAQRLREQGTAFDHIRYGGAGRWAGGQLQIAYDVHSTEGHGPLDTGSLTLTLAADGQELRGERWSNGEQASQPLRLVRRP